MALPSAKKNMDMSMMGLRPKMSARAPESGRIAVLESAYAEPTHVKSSPPSRSLVMVGSAVATAVRSRALRKMEVTTATKDSQKAEPLPVFREAGSTALSMGGGSEKDEGRDMRRKENLEKNKAVDGEDGV